MKNENVLEKKVSVFASATEVTPKEVTLRQFLFSTRHKENIETLRRQEDKATRDNLKKRLPCATISGTFEKRNMEGLRNYNGLVCMDLDEKDNPGKTPQQIKAELKNIPEILFAGLSVGGRGVFAIVASDNTFPEEHKKVVELLIQVFQHFGLKCDHACKDVSRLRFVSYDENPVVNENATAFPYLSLRERYQKPKPQGEIRPARTLIIRQDTSNCDKIENYITQIEQTRLDLTTDYDQWVRIGMSLASEFGRGGEEYFLRVSQFHPKFDQTETEKKFDNFLKTGKRIKIGTFFKICNQHNIKYKSL